MEHMSFFSASNGPIEGVDVPLLHEFVNCKKGALIENLIKYTTIHPLKFAGAQNALQSVFDFFEDAEEVARLAVEAAAISEEIESDDSVTSTELSEAMDEMPRHDLDSFLGDVESRRHLSDAEVELTASDASYREEIFELTGEEGVLPGEQVNVDAMIDNTVVGNEVRSASSDFTLPDEPDPVTKIEPESESSEEDGTSKRRGIRRRKKEE